VKSQKHKLYDPIGKKIIVSRDVKFAEEEKWEWKEHVTDDKYLASEPNSIEVIIIRFHEDRI